ncbi:replicative DNA helicase [Isosphaera pallida ATCC 43644]|uniref:Replicative DNA helicase n=1 Tax=Isosphaera pallida (strain ATCC 43644 / DSM 9630 / IS1B) TaxID=575540 RepID=E8R1M4_ISOPI|nr:replicative DNA helicase [Isosphaera pallida]ADV63442.1 replicative DNA helicase [Isosphaera pallida ATCC 43644]
MAPSTTGNGSAFDGHGNANGSSGSGWTKRKRQERPLSLNLDLLDPTQRVPPQNLAAERGVLAGVLLNHEIVHEIILLINENDFYRDAHRIIFRSIRRLYDQGKAIDLITLGEDLRKADLMEAVGGDQALVEIANSVPHAANTLYYAQIVREKSILRRLIHAAHEIIEDGFANRKSAEEVVDDAERRIFAIAEETATGETHRIDSFLQEAIDRIEARQERNQTVSGLPTGFTDLDALTSGFHPEQLIVIAARPSMGKTAFALNICQYAVAVAGTPVLFVSLEMGRLELVERLLCAWTRIDSRKFRGLDRISTREHADLVKAAGELESLPLFIDETASRTVLQIHANCRRLRQRDQIGLVVIDYIQLLDSEQEGRESRQEQIAKISRKLKAMARDLRIPVIALSQLNRGVEQREDRRPRMSDLRESGAIEQDADLVLLLHRPEYYDPNDQPGIAEVIVAKNRNGATGTVQLTFLKNIMRFENCAASIVPDAGPGSPF